MPDKRTWIQREVQTIVSVFSAMKWQQWVLSIAIIVIAIAFVQSAGEFLTSLYNRYDTYPPGTDTNMYSKSGALTAILSLAAAWLVAYVFRISMFRWYVPVVAITLCIGLTMVDMTGWLGWVVMSVYMVTIGASLGVRIFLFVPVLGFLIMAASMNSFVPEDWCKYELTMSPCDNGQYQIFENVKR